MPLTTEKIAALRRHIQNGEECIDGKACAHDEVLSLLDEVDRSRALLKRLEWAIRKPGDWDGRYCPACDAWDGDENGHKDDCALAALLGTT